MAHPGEVTEAEAFCTRVQKHIVNNAERWGSLKENIRVVSTVHTDVNMFIRSQPNISEVRTNQLTGTHSQRLNSLDTAGHFPMLVVCFLVGYVCMQMRLTLKKVTAVKLLQATWLFKLTATCTDPT